MQALRIGEAIGLVASWMSVMRIGLHGVASGANGFLYQRPGH